MRDGESLGEDVRLGEAGLEQWRGMRRRQSGRDTLEAEVIRGTVG